MLIIPYFGKVPSYYKIWEMSARKNNTIDFLIVTNDKSIVGRDNIKVEHMEFEDLKKRVQDKFDFNICLEKPYKLCDYKPAYGIIFEEELKGYDFWGHCDIDLIFGNIRHFVTDEILEVNDKIYEHGHFCLYRNVPQITNTFKIDGQYPEFNYREAYSTNDVFGFDEFHGMVYKCHRLKMKMYLSTNDFFDCKTDDLYFKDAFDVNKAVRTIIRYEDGKLYAKEITEGEARNKDFSNIYNREIMYFHFQKRYLKGVEGVEKLRNCFWVIPNEVIWGECSYQELYKEMHQLLYCYSYRFNKSKKKIIEHIKRFIDRKKTDKKYTIAKYIKERKDYQNRFRDNGTYLEQIYIK